MAPACPIDYQQIDANVARLTGVLVFLCLATAILTGASWLYLLLLVDFAARAFRKPQLSLLGTLARSIRPLVVREPAPVNAGPKLFAARIGLLFAVTLVLLQLAGQSTAVVVVGSLFALCAGLEGFVGFCVACVLYPYFRRAFALA